MTQGDELGLTIRLVRTWDARRDQYTQRMGRICECGQMMPYFVQITPMATDWDNDPD